jgi:hypothetical protein
MAHSFLYLPWKPEKHVYYTFVVVPIVSVESRIMCVCVYVCVYICVCVYVCILYIGVSKSS